MEQTTGNINEVNVEVKDREREVSYRKFKALGRKAIRETVLRLGRPFRYWRPGDPIRRFTIFEDGATYDLTSTDGIIESFSKTTPVDIIGGTTTPFSPEDSQKILAWLEEDEESSSEEPI